VWTAGNYYSKKPGAGIKTSNPTSVPVGSYSSAAKNIDSRYPPNADPNTVGFYKIHVDTDRPRPALPPEKTVEFNNLWFGSFHKGVCNFVRADGGIETVADDIDSKVYLAYGSRNGGEVAAQ
jgi:hypothetical protein